MKKLMGYVIAVFMGSIQLGMINKCIFHYPNNATWLQEFYILLAGLCMMAGWYAVYELINNKIGDEEKQNNDGSKYYFVAYNYTVGDKNGVGNTVFFDSDGEISIRYLEKRVCNINNFDNCIISYYKQISKEEYGE